MWPIREARQRTTGIISTAWRTRTSRRAVHPPAAIQCIPITEIAYGNAPRNEDTISIEVCHSDETGRFNDVTYESVVNLTAWLCKELKLGSKDVVRHYDINGKLCPKYYVEHEDAWVQFRKDVDAAIKEL